MKKYIFASLNNNNMSQFFFKVRYLIIWLLYDSDK
jgi:hypothetical protein